MPSYFEIDYKSDEGELSIVKREQRAVDVYQFLRQRKATSFVIFLMDGLFTQPQNDDEILGVWDGDEFITNYPPDKES